MGTEIGLTQQQSVWRCVNYGNSQINYCRLVNSSIVYGAKFDMIMLTNVLSPSDRKSVGSVIRWVSDGEQQQLSCSTKPNASSSAVRVNYCHSVC